MTDFSDEPDICPPRAATQNGEGEHHAQAEEEGGTRPPCHGEARGFLKVLLGTKCALQIVALGLALSLATGALVSAVPDVMEDRYARLLHDYDGQRHCSSFDVAGKPVECSQGGDSAQNAAAMSAFAQNAVILLSNSAIGRTSDCRGRRGFLALSFLLAALAPTALLLLQLIESMNPVWYYAADASSGLVSSLAMSYTMLSDIMAPSHRAPTFGVFFAAYLLGLALSQLLAKFLSHIAVSILAVVLLSMAVIFSLVAVPETLSDKARSKAISRRRLDDACMTYCSALLRPIHDMSILSRDRVFQTLAAVTFCSGLVFSSDKTLITYYMEDVLDISYQDVASMYFISSLLGIIVQTFLLKAAIGWLGEKGLLVATCISGAAHNAVYGLAHSRTGVFAAICMSDLTALTFPIQTSMRSNLVDDAELGRVQGAFQSLTAAADAVGPIVLQLIFHRTEHGAKFGPGTMFLFAALVYLSGGLFACSLPAERVNSSKRGSNNASVDMSGDGREPLLSSDNSIQSEAQV